MTASGRRCRAETTPSSARHRPYVPCFAAASPSSDASSTSAQSADTNSSLAELWMLCAAPRNLRTLAAGICPLMSAMPPTSPAPSLTTEPGTSACHSCTEKGKPPEPLRAASSRHAEAPSSLASTRSHASRLASGLMSDHQLESGCGRTRLFRHESTRTSSASYHGSSASRHAPHEANLRPGAPSPPSPHAATSRRFSADSSGAVRGEMSMSSTTTARRTDAPPDSASIAAARIATRPPIEWPTSTQRFMPAARTAASTSLASAAGSNSSGSPSGLSPCPRRS
mmetsp:Transcript_17771/g.52756  ORF Transcript_17771/g.52756 Transcript_17771/m.52756 type:complete len:283 (-) Transcript_17771:325-1173(-)